MNPSFNNSQLNTLADIKGFLKPTKALSPKNRAKAKNTILSYIKAAGFSHPNIISSHCLEILNLQNA